jgi:hypothetical protein
MCHGLCGEDYFLKLVKKFKKRIIRSRTNARSYRRNIKQVEFLARHSGVFGLAILINEKKRSFTVEKIKQEGDDDETLLREHNEFCEKYGVTGDPIPRGVAWPIQYFNGATLGGAA